MEMIEVTFNAALGVMTVLAFALFIIALWAYNRSRNTKMLFLGSAFFLFFAKGSWLSYLLFYEPLNEEFWLPVVIIDTVILLIFYASTLKR